MTNKLTLDIIKKIAKNCVDIQEKDGGIVFSRFSPKQLAVYSDIEAHRIRTYCPSGVCLDFYSDTEFVKINYSVMAKARTRLSFDFFINDVFVYSDGQNEIVDNEGEIYFNNTSENGKMNRITIFLPHLVEISLLDVEVSNNAIIKSVDTSSFKNYLAVGDSITQGMDSIHPSNTYPVQVAKYFSMNLLNQGVGGYIFNEESLDENLKFEPDLITVAYGTNDWGKFKAFDEFYTSVKGYINKLATIYKTAKIYVITPLWRADFETDRDLGPFSILKKTISEICEGYPNIKVIDGTTLVPNLTKYFKDEYLHPNDEGFMHYAMNLVKCIEEK